MDRNPEDRVRSRGPFGHFAPHLEARDRVPDLGGRGIVWFDGGRRSNKVRNVRRSPLLPENVTGQIPSMVFSTHSQGQRFAINVERPALQPNYRAGSTRMTTAPPNCSFLRNPKYILAKHPCPGHRRLATLHDAGVARRSLYNDCPDWGCEALSPSTAKFDRIQKLPVDFPVGVSHVWILDPTEHTVEIFKHAKGGYQLIGTHKDEDILRAEPFEELAIDLAKLWARK